MALSNNTFCWHGLVTPDSSKTVGFLRNVFGWTDEQVDMGGGPMTLLSNAGRPFAHIQPSGEDPAWWNNYLRVEDVDGATETLHGRGGEVVVPPSDIPVGRFATVKMPSGAAFSLFRERNDQDEDLPIGRGHVHWVDLHSTKLDADLEALSALGFAKETMAMPSGPYHILGPSTPTRAGAMQSMNEQAPPMWLAWIEVESTDATAKAIEQHGGGVIAPAWDAEGVGRMAITRDPVGLVFGLIQPPAS